ncbi:3-deoxy-D-manno-octulosonate 8-phosphate phosphatase [Anaerovibrio sp. JC8]|uniref:KdsC family phosphatase n=1 Tax=Anaerovibrio sp. JC8 TaxID=1240085 RepID=UPI000A0B6AD6|nr:HAD-IIIA family hydrolase [Anaerovibrio sp. JC8]ORU00939.1 3-deoxy-D-manno-octulosonate 8-phosphate phosphatase [Anaerovibrio sp. JC8]
MKTKNAASTIAKKIKMIIFDVDGTLTNGRIFMGPEGEAMKAFSARDGMGIAMAHKAGLKSAIITGRSSRIMSRRADELKFTAVYQGCIDKRGAYEELKLKFSLKDDEIAYVGDDINDIPLIMQAGLGCAVGDAVPEVRELAQVVADAQGGNGAVREIIEFILKEQGKWDSLVGTFIGKKPVDGVGQ